MELLRDPKAIFIKPIIYSHHTQAGGKIWWLEAACVATAALQQTDGGRAAGLCRVPSQRAQWQTPAEWDLNHQPLG